MASRKAETLPELLRNVRHNRREQRQIVAQHRIHRQQRRIAHRRVTALAQIILDRLQEERAILIPEEAVERLRVRVELVLRERIGHRRMQIAELGQNIDVHRREARRRIRRSRPLHHAEARCIVELVGEILALLNLLLVELHVRTRRRNAHQAEAQTIGAVLRNQIERIRAVAETLAHLAPAQIAHNRREEHIAERLAAREAVTGHNHAGHPEKDDIGPRHQIRRRVKLRAALRIHRRERPQPAAEPRIERILILHPVLGIGRRLGADVNIARLSIRLIQLRRLAQLRRLLAAIPDGDAVPPPELAADAPILNPLQPVRVCLGPVRRAEDDIALLHSLRRLLHAGILQEPLHTQARLNRHIGALADTDIVLVVLHLLQQALRLEKLNGLVARRKAIHPVQLRAAGAVDAAIGREDVDNLEVILHAHLKVRAIVRRRNLQRTRAEVNLNMLIGNDRNLRLAERANHLFADQRRKARIRGIHRHRHVRHNRLRARRRHEQLPAAVRQLVAHRVKLALRRRHDHLFIRERRAQHRIPVHHAATAVNQTLLEKLRESSSHRRRKHIIHREALAIPVAGAAQLLQLANDDAAVLLLPAPDHLHKSLAAHIVARARRILLGQLLLDASLRRNARVIRPRQPEHLLALLARAARENILNRVVEHMPHVQHARHVRRRNHNTVGRFRRVRISVETAALRPFLLPLLFNDRRFVRLGQFSHDARHHTLLQALWQAF